MPFKQLTTPLQALHHPLFEAQKLQVWMKREEQNNALIQGNKLYKLELNLTEHLKSDKKILLTFGGAYSNHLAATAAACHLLKTPVIGIVRAAELANNPAKWSHTLNHCKQNGMQLMFVSRADYRLKEHPNFIEHLLEKDGAQLSQAQYHALQHAWQQKQITILPEGGSNDLAVRGFAPLTAELQQQCPDWSDLFCAVGTGATLAGLVANSEYRAERTLYGVAVLQQSEHLWPQINDWILRNQTSKTTNNWQLLNQYHHGGYAKKSEQLQHFIKKTWQEINTEKAIPIEPIYTAKAFYAFWQKLMAGDFRAGAKIILLHSGGLQGLGPDAAPCNPALESIETGSVAP
ncbi:1-aminocyclopropane-1-carboxylate deaminase [Thiosulfatimonas sediminis]|uniref:1-aminocyclopropane-1-carboxylate deaminase n=1 Tax=Thiosulfatimonas sediminis TaxID=2675054 RepID=A0A6F8PVE9_9GAMM|nr:pyridoxal-phosphate dependent enzyme [Thiosulfatimonas sediminis]BBP46113.1 1-aminocyclopropane-1-carboxylate deaminase [Thiosulfatimonas sediminis]